MALIEQTLRDVLAAFRDPSPTPGGGSAAALTGALGASLVSMIAAMPKHRAASEQDVTRLRRAGQLCAQLGDRLAALADEDARAYDAVVAAYRLPKASDADKAARAASIQASLRGAIDVPLEVMRQCAAAIEAADAVAAFGNPNAASDIGVALELLGAAARGARLNVDINLGTVSDAGYADGIRHQAGALDGRCAGGAAAARARLQT